MNGPLDFSIPALGPCRYDSPLLACETGEMRPHFVDDRERIVFDDRVSQLSAADRGIDWPAYVLAGPREKIYFAPQEVRAGIVTCGGLCPGINDVIRSLVMTAWYRYGVRTLYGFRYGFRGLVDEQTPPWELTPELVSHIHEQGGTILGSSRGHQDVGRMVQRLAELRVQILFVIGGDGTIRGAMALAEEARRRNYELSVIGLPKTIDNDIRYIDQSFGFETAYAEAVEAIRGAHTEAVGALGGIGLVKLMGRESGFIACHASLAASHVNLVLIPEVPFRLEGENGLLRLVERRLQRRQHALIVVAEGAGQDLIPGDVGRDRSGNLKLKDIGLFLVRELQTYFAQRNTEVSIKYIDPSYIIRSVPARPPDSVYCSRLAQNAVHAAMCGKTEMVVGSWHGRFVHVPMRLLVTGRQRVDPGSDLWLSVLEATGQPAHIG
jgi:6-phosphofructokinase 1